MTADGIKELANQKKLPLDFFRKQLDLRDLGNGVIGIPYFGETGEELFVRQRNPPGSEPRFRQPKRMKLLPYGLNRLGAARKVDHIYLCEGESDTWTLWHCGLPALGIPGASAAKSLTIEHVESIAGINIVPDNDEAGEQYVEGIRRRLGELGYDGRLRRVAVPAPHKDVSAWYIAAGSPAKFRDELATAVQTAELMAVEAGQLSRNGIAKNQQQESTWEELIPLSAAPEVPPFPVEILPAPLARFVEEVAASIPCPMDYVGVPLLTLAGAAIGASRALEIKDGWTERPALYAAVVCPPSAGKSPALKYVATPYYHEQSRLHEIYRRERRAREDGIDDAPKPVERVLYVDDITTEKLASVLRENPRGVAIIKDELTAWVRGMDAYRSGKGADKQFWLSAWAGSPISVHRKIQDDGPVRVAHPFVAIVGGLPPDLLTTLRGERAVADGFMDRIFFTFAEPLPAQGENWRCVADEHLDAWRNTLARLWELQQEEDAERGPRPHFVRLTSCGRKGWERFTTDLANEMNRDDFPDCLRGPWGKMKGYGARLALILQQLRMVHGDADAENVDGESINRAATLIRYFQGHARKVYALIDADPKIADGRRVLRWIVESRMERFTKRDAYQALKGTFKTVEDLQPVLMLLEKHGYVHMEPASDRTGPGRKRSPGYEVNPDVFLPDPHYSHNPQN